MNASVTNIQRYSVNDGYGIRTIVFLQGCSLRCAWCQNPETMGTASPALMVSPDSCSGCGACVPECPHGALTRTDDGIGYDRAQCRACFACVPVCYFGARKPSGKDMELDAVFAEVMKDESFFRASGGGLTLSGGEPLLQDDFCRDLLAKAKTAGIHTAVETAGNVPAAAFDKVLPHTDLVLYDMKFRDAERHRRYTGAANWLILDNLRGVAASGVETIIRVPLIPGLNDGVEFRTIADFTAELSGVDELHILPYHALGVSKYGQLGLEYPMEGTSEENAEEVERCRAYAESVGLRVSIGGAGFASVESKGRARSAPKDCVRFSG